MAEQKTHFPQVPLRDLQHLILKRANRRRPGNVTVQQRKGKEPYSVPVNGEFEIVEADRK